MQVDVYAVLFGADDYGHGPQVFFKDAIRHLSEGRNPLSQFTLMMTIRIELGSFVYPCW
jgi:hypothetical protein